MMDDGRIFWDGMEFRVMFFITTILLSRAICYTDVFLCFFGYELHVDDTWCGFLMVL
jgi:hypothetical protein